MIFITGDTHREFSRLYSLYGEHNTLIILGDACINYCLDDKDYVLKDFLNKLGIRFFCIRGNHEERPENIATYKEVEMFSGKVFIEERFPNLVFAKDGEVYNIDGNKVLVIGGAYSVDKEYRIKNGYTWFKDEQLSKEEMGKIFENVKGQHFDIVLSHTCPHKYEPTEMFLKDLDQSRVDKTMEIFLDKVEESISYDKWYCGHYHTSKKIDKMQFMFKGIELFSKKIEQDKTLKKDIK